MLTIAIAGKPNCGKSTFFTASTLAPVDIANYPFTTIDANTGVAYLRVTCACQKLGVKCGHCTDGVRFIPVGLIDVAGLVPDAHEGRGLGNQFLDHLREADAIIHIIDGSGNTDSEGNPVDAGSHDPRDDIGFIEHEMSMWVYGILNKTWSKMQRSTQQRNYDILDAIAEALGGLKITYEQVRDAEREAEIDLKSCSKEELIKFCSILVPMSKPMVVVANKADLASEEMCNELKKSGISFASSASELALRKAAEGKFITYLPGDATFTIPPDSKLSAPQKKGLMAIQSVMDRFGSTGVQQAINGSVFDLLDMIVVYPVVDENKYCDGQGRILPDAFLMKRGSTPRDLAYQVHSEIGDGFIHAVDAKTKMRIKDTHELKDGDVIRIVSAK